MNRRDFELITWSKTFACGIKLIDDQHKNLVDLVNEMFNHVSGDDEQEKSYLSRVINEAVMYIKVHFATEEKIMMATQFSGYADHKIAHDRFIATVGKNISDFSSGKKFTLYSFTNFLKNWILSHIAVMDKQYIVYLKKIASIKADGKLSISLEDIQAAVKGKKDISYSVLKHTA